jgi:hypothetical protein
VKGTGNVEATEEETLAALGEVIMVKGEAPAVAAVAPPPKVETPAVDMTTRTKPVEKPAPAVAVVTPKVETKVSMAPRKIGRGSDEVAAVTPSMGAQAAEHPMPSVPVANEPTKVEAKVAETKPMPAATHASMTGEPTRVETAPTASVTPVKAIDAPQTETPVTAPVTTPAPVVAARPAIDKATVSSVISTHRPEVLKCFAEGKKKNASMKGTISLQLQVEASGKVHRAQVQSTLNAPLVAACVVRAANTWAFPKRTGGEVATVEYPFTIN